MLTKAAAGNIIASGENMIIKIGPGRLSGSVTPPPSKSLLHRYILCAALAEGESRISGAALSDDICATLGCVEALGAKWHAEGDLLSVRGIGGTYSGSRYPHFDCGESGTTLRFMIPVASVLCGEGKFAGKGRLFERPLEPYYKVFDANGIEHLLNADMLKIRGTLDAGKYILPGKVSSQFFSGLLYALALCDGWSEIISEGALESAPYADMTCSILKSAGINVSRDGCRFFVQGGTFYAFDCCVEPDWSQAAFWIAANMLGSDIVVNGLETPTLQGDSCFTEIAAALSKDGNAEIDMSQNPDLLPPAAAMAALRKGICRFTGCARLRYKESDRLAAVRDVLCGMGADVDEFADGLVIRGKERLSGGVELDCHGDHRIAMMTAIAALRCERPVHINGYECVSKSYPAFFEQFKLLGGAADAV